MYQKATLMKRLVTNASCKRALQEDTHRYRCKKLLKAAQRRSFRRSEEEISFITLPAISFAPDPERGWDCSPLCDEENNGDVLHLFCSYTTLPGLNISAERIPFGSSFRCLSCDFLSMRSEPSPEANYISYDFRFRKL